MFGSWQPFADSFILSFFEQAFQWVQKNFCRTFPWIWIYFFRFSWPLNLTNIAKISRARGGDVSQALQNFKVFGSWQIFADSFILPFFEQAFQWVQKNFCGTFPWMWIYFFRFSWPLSLTNFARISRARGGNVSQALPLLHLCHEEADGLHGVLTD